MYLLHVSHRNQFKPIMNKYMTLAPIESCPKTKWYACIIVILGVIVIVLSVLLALFAGGIAHTTSPRFQLVQAHEILQREKSIENGVVFSRKANRILWVANQSVCFARFDNNMISNDQIQIPLNHGPVKRMAASSDHLAILVNDRVTLFRLNANKCELMTSSLLDHCTVNFVFSHDETHLHVASVQGLYHFRGHEQVGQVTVQDMTEHFGHKMVQNAHWIIASDPSAHFDQGVVVIMDHHSCKQTLTSNRIGFGSNLELSTDGSKLFVGYAEDSVIEYYTQSSGKFIHLQTIFNPVISHTVSFLHFGTSMKCNDRWFLVSAPAEPQDKFSVVLVYSFDSSGRVQTPPQQISRDLPLLGASAWLHPRGDYMILSHSMGSAFGQLLLWKHEP